MLFSGLDTAPCLYFWPGGGFVGPFTQYHAAPTDGCRGVLPETNQVTIAVVTTILDASDIRIEDIAFELPFFSRRAR